MSLASRTREAVRARPFLYEGLRAGVLNYTAAARFLELGADDPDAVVAALRRYAEDLPDYEERERAVRVSMESGLGESRDPDPSAPLLTVGDTALVAGAGSATAVLATGEVDPMALATVLGRLATADVGVTAAGVAGDAMVVVVTRRDGPDALRTVEDALEAVPAGRE